MFNKNGILKNHLPLGRTGRYSMVKLVSRSVLGLLVLIVSAATLAQETVVLDSIGFANLSGDSIEIQLTFDSAPPEPSGFVLDNPARISLDLLGVSSGLSQQRFNIDSNNAQSVMVLDDGNRTRLVVNLDQLVSYETQVVGNQLTIQVGNDAQTGGVAVVGRVAAGISGTSAGDERDHARAVANAAGAEHIEINFSDEDFWQLLPEIAKVMDDPAADYAVLPTYLLASKAKQAGLKVILTGEGGDELFGGYARYRRAQRWRILGGRRMRSKGIFHGLGVLRGDVSWRRGMELAEKEATQPGRSRLQSAQAVDCADWLPNDLLTKLDRCLMAFGVEGRVPFLDRHMAEFAYPLPDPLKVKHKHGKWLLRKWLETGMPASKPFSRKRGFTVPVGEWISQKGRVLGELVAKQPGIQEACNVDSVPRLFQATDQKAGKAAWTLLFYALWHRAHILGLDPAGDVMETLSDHA